MERIHRADAGVRCLAAGPIQDQPYVVKHHRALKVLLVEPILQMPLVKKGLRADFMSNVRAAQKDPMRIFQNVQREAPKILLAIVSCD